MPFTRLEENHECTLPATRDDGSELQIGDQWECDHTYADGRVCFKLYRWTRVKHKAEDELYWRSLT